jgi:hypothetical protein
VVESHKTGDINEMLNERGARNHQTQKRDQNVGSMLLNSYIAGRFHGWTAPLVFAQGKVQATTGISVAVQLLMGAVSHASLHTSIRML